MARVSADAGEVRRRPRRDRLAPKGWPDFWLQVALLGSFEVFYALSGAYGRARAGVAVTNARDVVRVERGLGIAWEHGIQAWTLREPGLAVDVANRTYFLSQFVVSTVFLLWVYARHTERFGRVRNALLAANLVALTVLFLYPLAPPRMLPGGGFVDTLDTSGVSLHASLIDALNNPYSAMPSLHASYAVVIGAAGVVLSRRWWWKLVWALYPVLVVYSVIATGNHFVLDVAAGVVALAATPAVDAAERRIARWRRWGLQPRRVEDHASP